MHTVHFEEKNEKSLSNVLWSTSQIRRLSTGNDHIDHWRNTQKTHTLPCSNSRTEKVLSTLYILYIYVWNNLLLHRTCCTKPPACKSQKTNVLPWDVIELLFLLPKKKFSPDRNMAQNSKEFVNSDNLLPGVFDTVIDISYRWTEMERKLNKNTPLNGYRLCYQCPRKYFISLLIAKGRQTFRQCFEKFTMIVLFWTNDLFTHPCQSISGEKLEAIKIQSYILSITSKLLMYHWLITNLLPRPSVCVEAQHFCFVV